MKTSPWLNRVISSFCTLTERTILLRLIPAGICAILLLAVQSTFAATDTWVGNSSVLWSDTNWNNGVSTTVASGDSLLFGVAGTAGAALTDDLAPAFSIGGIAFSSSASAFTITGGNSITNGAGGIVDSATGRVETINIPIILGAAQSFSVLATGTLTLGGQISGSQNLTFTGGGRVNLNAVNTYAGITVISNSTAVVLGTGATVGNSTGTIDVGDSSTGDTSSLTLSGSNTVTAGTLNIAFNTGGSGVNGTVTVNGTDTINAGSIILDNGSHGGATKGTTATFKLGSGALLTLQGASGSGAVTLLDIGDYNFETGGSTGTSINGTVDFSPGIVTGTVTTIDIATGKAGAGPNTGIANGSLTFANGALSATTINIARIGSQPSAGTLTLATGGTGTLTVGSGGITFDAAGNSTGSSGTGSVVINGATLLLGGNITSNIAVAVDANVTLSGGILDMGGFSIGTSADPVTFTTTSGTLRNVGSINTSAGVTMATAGKTLVLGGVSNNYTGATLVSSGTLQLGDGVNQTTFLNTASITATSSGVLAINLGNGGTIPNNITDSSMVNAVQSGTNTLSGIIGGTGAFNVNGGGITILTNANIYSGATTVGPGTLELSTATANNIPNSTNVTVNSNGTLDLSHITNVGGFSLASGQTLNNNGLVNGVVKAPAGSVVSGTGTYNSDVNVSGGTLAPDGVGAIGVVTIGGNLTVSSGTFSVDMLQGSADEAIVDGAATFGGNSNLGISAPGAVTAGDYVVLTSTSLSGITGGFFMNIGRETYTIDTGALAGNILQIDVTGSPANLTWTGTDGAEPGIWEDKQVTHNWTGTGLGDTSVFFDGDAVTFNDNNFGNYNVTISGTVSPTSVLVSSTGSYTIGGGKIAGIGPLTQAGSGTLTLSSADAYTGATTVTSGALVITGALGNTAVTGSGGAISLQNTGAISQNTVTLSGASLAETAANALGGSAALTINSGTATLSQTNNYSGATTLNGGFLSFGSIGSPIGAGALVFNGGSLDNTSGAAMTLTNNNAVTFGGDLTFIGSNNLNLGTGAVTLNVTPNITIGSGTFTIGGIIGTGVAAGLTTSGSGTLLLNGANAYSGPTTINPGAKLQIGNGTNATAQLGDATVSGSSSPVIDNGALVYDYSGSPTAGTVTGVSGSGSILLLRGGGNYSIKLDGSNSGFTGPITIQNGTRLQISSDITGFSIADEFVSASNITIQSGGAYYMDSTGAPTATFTGNWVVSGSGFAGDTGANQGAIRVSSTTVITGSVALAATTLFNVGASLTISGPITDNGGGFALWKDSASTMTLSSTSNNYSGGTTVFAGTLQLGANNALPSTGILTLGYGGANVGSLAANSAGTLDLNGFNTTVGGLASAGTGINEIGNGSTASSSILTYAGASGTFGGIIIDHLGTGTQTTGLTVASGTLTLTGNNTYSGPTNVKDGALDISGLIADSAVTVGDPANLTAPATLAGSGTVGNLTLGAAAGNTGAMVDPSNGAAETTVGTTLTTGSFNMTLGSDATLALEVGRIGPFAAGGGTGAAGGDVSDRIKSTADITLDSTGGNLQLTLMSTGYTLADGDVLFLVINGGADPVNGEFATVNGQPLGPDIASDGGYGSFSFDGLEWDITNSASFVSNEFSGGQDIAIVAVPEPHTWALVIAGLGVLLCLQRRRKRA